MRTLTGLSVEYVTFDQNVLKCKFGLEFLLLRLTGKTDDFYELTMLIVQFIQILFESGMVSLA